MGKPKNREQCLICGEHNEVYFKQYYVSEFLVKSRKTIAWLMRSKLIDCKHHGICEIERKKI